MRYIPGSEPPHAEEQQNPEAAAYAYPEPTYYDDDDDDEHNSEDERMDRTEPDEARHKRRKYENDAEFYRGLRERWGWEIEPMRQDGACLFRAVAFHLFGDQDMHDIVRQRCLDYMSQNREYFRQFITEDFERYIQRKRIPNCFGNHTEIQALTEMYNRNIEVYEYDDEPINTFLAPEATEAPIRLSYHGNIHYNAIVDPNFSTFGVGLGFSDLRPGEADRRLMEEACLMSEQELIEKQILEESKQERDLEEAQTAIEDAILLQSQLEYYNQLSRNSTLA